MEVDIPALQWFWNPILPGVGLSPNATVSVNLSTKLAGSEKPAPNVFVVLFSESQIAGSFDLLVSRSATPSSYLPCAWRASLAGAVERTHRVQASSTGRYWLGLLRAVADIPESVSGEVSFVNPEGEHLPVQQQAVPTVILVVAALFFASGVAFLAMMSLWRRGRTRLHALIVTTIFAKCLVLVLVRDDISRVSRTGQQSVARQIFWQLLRQLEATMEVAVFYVVGLGWKIMRPHLRQSEWAFGATVAAVSLFLGGFEVMCQTFEACLGQSYLLTQFTLHSLCFLVVIVATNFNIFTLQRQISEALATPETGALYAKHRAYCFFRGSFLFFIVANVLALHVLNWDELWVVVLVREVSLWIVHSSVFLLFRPGMRHLRVFELAVVESSSDGEDSDDDESDEGEATAGREASEGPIADAERE